MKSLINLFLNQNYVTKETPIQNKEKPIVSTVVESYLLTKTPKGNTT